MFWNPVTNIASCIISKPPLVVFTLCLFTFLITTVSLAIYVQHSDQVENKDAEGQWRSLTKFMDHTGFCVQEVGQDLKINYSWVDKVNISANAFVTVSVANRSSFLHGIVSLKAWTYPCLKEKEKPENVDIFFHIPASKGGNERQSVCVIISGPTDFMPKIHTSQECYIEKENETSKRMTIFNNMESGPCGDSSLVKIEFDHSSTKEVQSEEYLSMTDKSLINLHLIVTSYFIIFMILVVICYAVIKGNKFEQKQDTRHLLTGKAFHT